MGGPPHHVVNKMGYDKLGGATRKRKKGTLLKKCLSLPCSFTRERERSIGEGRTGSWLNKKKQFQIKKRNARSLLGVLAFLRREWALGKAAPNFSARPSKRKDRREKDHRLGNLCSR